MPGMYKYSMEIETNVKQLLSDMKEAQDRLDSLEGKEYNIKLNIDEKSLGNVISKLEKMLDSLAKGTGDFKQFENLSKELSSIISEVQSFSKAFGKVDDSGTKTLLSSIQSIDKSLSDLSQHITGANIDFGSIGKNASDNVGQINEVKRATEDLTDATKDLAKAQQDVNGNKSNISSDDFTIKDVFQNDSNSSSTTKEETTAMEQVEAATEQAVQAKKDFATANENVEATVKKSVEAIKQSNEELSEYKDNVKVLSQVGEIGDDKYSITSRLNDGQIQVQSWKAKRDEKGNYVYDERTGEKEYSVSSQIISNYEKLEKTIISADNALRKMQDDKTQILALDKNASTSFIDAQIEDQKQYIALLEETIEHIASLQNELIDKDGNSYYEKAFEIDPDAIQSAREKAAREYTLSSGAKQEKSNAKQSASDEQKRLKNIEQVNRALNKQQILIDSIEKTYSREKNGDLDKAVDNENNLKALNDKKTEIADLINKLSGQERNSSNEAEFLQLEKLIAEYKELAMYKLKANNPTEQKLGGKKLEVAIEEQIAQYDKLIAKAEKYGDETSDIVDALKKQREILGGLDNNGKHTATSNDYINARNEYRIANSQVSSIETNAKVDAEKAKEIKKVWDAGLKTIQEYMDAQTELNNLKAADKGTGKNSKAIEEQARKVEELREKAIEAKVNLASMTDFHDIDMSTWKQWLEVMRNFAEATKGSKESIAKLEDSIKNVNNSSLNSIGTDIEKYQNKIDTINYGRKDDEKSSEFKKFVEDYQQAINALTAKKKELEKTYKDSSVEIIPQEELNAIKKLEAALKKLDIDYKTIFKGSVDVSRTKELDTITKYMEKNTRISKKAKKELQGFIDILKNNGADANVEEIHTAFLKVCDVERKAKREGQRFLDVIKEKVWYQWAAQIGGYFGLNDIIGYFKQGVQVVREFDSALTEMKKVSEESSSSLKRLQDASFDLANEVGTTAIQIQNSIADFMRAGDSVEEAQKHAFDANVLLQVSEFDNIEDATSALVSMSKAWNNIDTKHINDVLNILGNNMPIATDELASSLQRSAGTLATLGATIEEAAALTVAGNSILQDPDSVAAGELLPEYIVICRYFNIPESSYIG